MLEGCVTVVYVVITVVFAVASLLISCIGQRDWLASKLGKLGKDPLWPLLLLMACAAYAASMGIAAEGRACRDWW